MLDHNTQHFEGMHSDARILRPLLTLKNEIDGAREEADESIPLGGCDEQFAQLELQHFAHGLQRGLQLGSRVPARLFA